MGLEDNYKRAVIKLAENMPQIMKEINDLTKALKEHTRQLKLTS